MWKTERRSPGTPELTDGFEISTGVEEIVDLWIDPSPTAGGMWIVVEKYLGFHRASTPHVEITHR
jgi:hypothetical protein